MQRKETIATPNCPQNYRIFEIDRLIALKIARKGLSGVNLTANKAFQLIKIDFVVIRSSPLFSGQLGKVLEYLIDYLLDSETRRLGQR